jgi:hypothetical protein
MSLEKRLDCLENWASREVGESGSKRTVIISCLGYEPKFTKEQEEERIREATRQLDNERRGNTYVEITDYKTCESLECRQGKTSIEKRSRDSILPFRQAVI